MDGSGPVMPARRNKLACGPNGAARMPVDLATMLLVLPGCLVDPGSCTNRADCDAKMSEDSGSHASCAEWCC